MPDEIPLPPPKPDEPYVALSLQQPWAWLMIRPDIIGADARAAARAARQIKDIENRKWQTRVRGWVYVHASKTIDREGYVFAGQHFPDITLPAESEMQRGGIIGRMRIDDCVLHHGSPWFFGPWGFVIGDSYPNPFRPFGGSLQFFGCKEAFLL